MTAISSLAGPFSTCFNYKTISNNILFVVPVVIRTWKWFVKQWELIKITFFINSVNTILLSLMLFLCPMTAFLLECYTF